MSLILEIDGTRAIREKVREGSIATDLMKPINLPLSFFSDGFGMTAFHAMTIIPNKISWVFPPGSSSLFGHDATASLPHRSSLLDPNEKFTRSFARNFQLRILEAVVN